MVSAWIVSLLFLNAHSSSQGCFVEHLREARELNMHRLPLYSKASQGRSLRISSLLISTEWLAQIPALMIEKEAKAFIPLGVNLTCESFVSMKSVGPYHARVLPSPTLSHYRSLDLKELGSQSKKLIRKNDYHALTETLLKELHILEQEPRFHCMTRHLLESLAKIAMQAPSQLDKIKRDQTKRDLNQLIERLLRQHLMTLGMATTLDDWAAPLQAEGIPIICQDVPKIL